MHYITYFLYQGVAGAQTSSADSGASPPFLDNSPRYLVLATRTPFIVYIYDIYIAITEKGRASLPTYRQNKYIYINIFIYMHPASPPEYRIYTPPPPERSYPLSPPDGAGGRVNWVYYPPEYTHQYYCGVYYPPRIYTRKYCPYLFGLAKLSIL